MLLNNKFIMFKIVVFIAPILFSSINFNAYLKGSKPNIYQLLFSILFVALWFLYGLYMGNKKVNYFLKLSTLYWGTGLLLFVLSYFSNLYVIFIPVALYFAGPLYGLKYFLDTLPDIQFVVLSIIIICGLSVIGYIVGKNMRYSG